MDSKSMSRIWITRKMKVYSFLFHLSVLASLAAFVFASALIFSVSLSLSVLFHGLSDQLRIDLEFSLPP